ncbi:hypothetical protein ACSQ67_009734 [Phaseolus vulgaris]
MEINLGKIPFDVDFHPSDNLVATALINGDIHLYRFGPDSVPVRAARFLCYGLVLSTASADCSILATDVETGSKITRIDNAHESSVNRTAINRLMNLTEFIFASGDDEGFIKVWDIRTGSCCKCFNAHDNYISDMTFASDRMKILTTRYRFSLDDSVPVRQLEVHAHANSKRAARFIDCERVLFTASSDCSVLATDVETRSTITHIDNVHEAALNRLINLTQSTVVSPDDVGFIKIWDIRKRSCYNYFNAHENYISDMTFASDAMKLLTTSEDGTLSVCNLRTNTVQSRSEISGLLSVVLMKGDQNGRKFVCGLQNGIIPYSWGCFKNFSDVGLSMYMNNSIDTMLKFGSDPTNSRLTIMIACLGSVDFDSASDPRPKFWFRS